LCCCCCLGRAVDVTQQQSRIFSDVPDEYAELSPVISRLLEWKSTYGQSYDDAYVPLSTPDVCDLYVRVQVRCVVQSRGVRS
jgi:hypothetical protein